MKEYLSGGKPIRDINVAVYTGYCVPPEDPPEYIDELHSMLENRCRGN